MFFSFIKKLTLATLFSLFCGPLFASAPMSLYFAQLNNNNGQASTVFPAFENNLRAITAPTHGFTSTVEQRLVDFVNKTVDNLHYSSYKLGGTHFDSERGVYIVDCSTYVDNILQTVNPQAYSSLVNSTGTYKPTSQHYYNFFHQLSYDPKNFWNKVNAVDQLQAGDILVFRNTKTHVVHHRHHRRVVRTVTTGHVMVVMDKPVKTPGAFLVRVTDSAPQGHSEDTRSHSGIGIGTLMLKVNPQTGQPSAYAWKMGSGWERNVNFAMGRPSGSG